MIVFLPSFSFIAFPLHYISPPIHSPSSTIPSSCPHSSIHPPITLKSTPLFLSSPHPLFSNCTSPSFLASFLAAFPSSFSSSFTPLISYTFPLPQSHSSIPPLFLEVLRYIKTSQVFFFLELKCLRRCSEGGNTRLDMGKLSLG